MFVTRDLMNCEKFNLQLSTDEHYTGSGFGGLVTNCQSVDEDLRKWQ